MAQSSTKVFILEVMGRHAGWIAASGGLAREKEQDGPQIILFPEVTFDEASFLKEVKSCVEKYGFCSIVVSEGVKDKSGKFLADAGMKDAFGHTQLGGVAPVVAQIVKDKLGLKYHWAVSDYLQRAARHIASKTDVDQAYAVGKAAVEFAIKGENNIMPTIVRKSDKPYSWEIGKVALEKVANVEHKMPDAYISKNGFHITDECRNYLSPLISGESYPPFENGLPRYVVLKKEAVLKKLKGEFKVN